MTLEQKSKRLPSLAILILFIVGSIALYKGAFPPPVRISPLTVNYSSTKVLATTKVTNETSKNMVITVHFDFCHSGRGGRFIPPPNMTTTSQEIPTQIDAHSSRNVSCEFGTWGNQDQNTVTAFISKYE